MYIILCSRQKLYCKIYIHYTVLYTVQCTVLYTVHMKYTEPTLSMLAPPCMTTVPWRTCLARMSSSFLSWSSRLPAAPFSAPPLLRLRPPSTPPAAIITLLLSAMYSVARTALSRPCPRQICPAPPPPPPPFRGNDGSHGMLGWREGGGGYSILIQKTIRRSGRSANTFPPLLISV